MARISVLKTKADKENNQLNLAVEDFRTFRQGGFSEYTTKNLQHTVASCVKLLSDKASTLPVRVLNRETGELGPHKNWMDYPNPDQTWPEFMQYAVASYLRTGACYIYGDNDLTREPSQLYVFSNDEVEVEYQSGIKMYRLSSEKGRPGMPLAANRVAHIKNIATSYTDKGKPSTYYFNDIIKSAGYSLDYIRDFYENGAQFQYAILSPESIGPDATYDLDMQLDDKSGQPSGRIVLENGMTIVPLSLSQEQMQFMDTLKHLENIITVQCFFIPASYYNLAESGTSESYTNIPAIATRLWEDALEPIIKKFEYGITRMYLPSTQIFDYDELGMISGTPTDRTLRAQALADIEVKLTNQRTGAQGRIFENDLYAKTLGISPAMINESQPTRQVEEGDDE